MSSETVEDLIEARAWMLSPGLIVTIRTAIDSAIVCTASTGPAETVLQAAALGLPPIVMS